MDRIYKIRFSVYSKFNGNVRKKLNDMLLRFCCAYDGKLLDSFSYVIFDITDGQKKEVIAFLRDLTGDTDFRFSACFHVGFVG